MKLALLHAIPLDGCKKPADGGHVAAGMRPAIRWIAVFPYAPLPAQKLPVYFASYKHCALFSFVNYTELYGDADGMASYGCPSIDVVAGLEAASAAAL